MNTRFDVVKRENLNEILNLSIKAEQKGLVETTKECLYEANNVKLWNPIGMYINDLLVGFAMYGMWEEDGKENRVWLDRFLIDEKFQGRGYGKILLINLIDKIANEYGKNELFLSLYEDNAVALSLYKKCGFEFNGETDINGELVMCRYNEFI